VTADSTAPDPRHSRAAMIRRLAVATVVPLFFLAGPFVLGLGEAAASLTGGMERFSLGRVAFVLTMALVPLTLGAAATELAKPWPVGGPAVFTAAFLVVWGALLYRSEGGFALFVYLAVTAPAYLLGVVARAVLLARRARRDG
jgi:hypothetical protein